MFGLNSVLVAIVLSYENLSFSALIYGETVLRVLCASVVGFVCDTIPPIPFAIPLAISAIC